jgi:hypothetical protein
MRALCLAGPTASGKTAAALAIAARWPVEIVSVDSALVFRGMDVGTAKPSAEERRAVPHHLIDIRDPAQAYSAAEFVRDAQECMAAIAARGRIPLLVGGTMLYFKALFDGLDALPAADAAVRAALDAQAACPSTRVKYTGAPSKAESSVPFVGHARLAQSFWSQPRPSTHSPCFVDSPARFTFAIASASLFAVDRSASASARPRPIPTRFWRAGRWRMSGASAAGMPPCWISLAWSTRASCGAGRAD